MAAQRNWSDLELLSIAAANYSDYSSPPCLSDCRLRRRSHSSTQILYTSVNASTPESVIFEGIAGLRAQDDLLLGSRKVI